MRGLAAALLAVVIGAGIMVPSDATAGAGNYIKCEFPLSSFSTGAATTATATCDTKIVDTKWVHEKTILVVDSVFYGGNVDGGTGVTAATVSIGKSGSVARYVAATNVFTGASTGFTNGVAGTPGFLLEAGEVSILATLTTTTANTNVLSAGKVTAYFLYSAAP